MSTLDEVVDDAERWLAAQPEPVRGSATWYGFNNLRSFVASLKADPSISGIERACGALGYHLRDQLNAYDEFDTVWRFFERARNIARGMKRA